MFRFIRRPISVVFLVSVIGLAPLANVALSSAASGTTLTGGVATFAEGPGSPPNFIFPFFPGQYYSVQDINQFQFLMYRPLYWFGNGNQPSLNTALSIANAPTFTNNNTTVTLTLKNYQWSNGEILTAQDVVFFMNMLKVESTQFGPYQTGSIPDDVVSMSTPNSSTVIFNLNAPVNPQWWTYNDLSQITPMPMAWDVSGSNQVSGSQACGTTDWNSVLVTQVNGSPTPANAAATSCADVWTYLENQAGYDPSNPGAPNTQLSTYATNPLWQVVDGPWHLTAFDALGNATFEPNASYSGPIKPTLSKFVEVPFSSNADEFTALSNNQLTVGYLPFEDVTSPAVSPTQPGPNNSALVSNYNIDSVNSFGFNYFPYNFRSSGDGGYAGQIFGQLYFRQAMQMLVDQTSYVNNFYKGYATPTYSPIPMGSDNPFTSSYQQANPYPYDPSAAMTLLQNNGWTINPGGTDVCNDATLCGVPVGTPLSFIFDYATGETAQVQVAQAEVASWNAAGINVAGNPETFNNEFHDFGCSPACQWDLSSWGGGWLYGLDYYPSGEYQFLSNAGFNLGSYSNPSIDSLINLTTSTSANLDAYQSAIATQLPVVWQPTSSYVAEVQNTLQGATPLSSLDIINPENWSFSSTPVTEASISGTVTSATSGSALAGICVMASSNSAGGTLVWPGATTATDGTYSIAGLPAGNYNVEFTTGCGSSSDYVSQWYSGAADVASSTTVNDGASGASNVNAAMALGGEISGNVVSGSTPVAQVCVNAYPSGSTTPIGATGLTDANGNYAIAALPPGSYTISADPTCGVNGATSPYAYQTYATTINVTPGSTSPPVNFDLFSSASLPPAPPPSSVSSADFGTPTSAVTTPNNPMTITQSELGASATLTVPANALPSGTTVSLYPVTNPATLAQLLPSGSSYLASFAVSWLAPDGSVPTATAPLSLTITDPNIIVGDVIYGVTSSGLTALGTAVVNGSVTVTFTSDPTFIVSTPTLPTVALSVPANGSTFVTGQSVPAKYSCTAGAGAVLASCTGTVANGALIPTSTTGTYTFSVTATDTDGQYSTVTSSYIVVSMSSATNAKCVGVLPAGVYDNVTASTNCVITVADDILGNFQVTQGGSLQDVAALIGGNLQVTHALWVDIRGGSVGGNLQVKGLISKPSGTGDGAAANDLCGLTVGGNVQLQNNAAGAPFEIGAAPDCSSGLAIGGNLQVQNNAGNVVIGSVGQRTSAQGNVQVMNNSGGGSLTDTVAGGNCKLQNNTPSPGIVGSLNTARGDNSCDQTA